MSSRHDEEQAGFNTSEDRVYFLYERAAKRVRWKVTMCRHETVMMSWSGKWGVESLKAAVDGRLDDNLHFPAPIHRTETEHFAETAGDRETV